MATRPTWITILPLPLFRMPPGDHITAIIAAVERQRKVELVSRSETRRGLAYRFPIGVDSAGGCTLL